jgi:Fe-S cluster biosynthesis and repair protein YggX
MGCGSVPPVLTEIRPGARKVFCVKFQREMEGLDEIPFEGHPLKQMDDYFFGAGAALPPDFVPPRQKN